MVPSHSAPLICLWLCRYGFNSHGLSVVEHRLRARQQKQAKLTEGKVGCIRGPFLFIRRKRGRNTGNISSEINMIEQ